MTLQIKSKPIKPTLLYLLCGITSFTILYLFSLNQYTHHLLLITHLPLFIFYAYVGFLIDLIFSTGMGYQSLSVYPVGTIFITYTTYLYNFLFGIFIKYLLSGNPVTKSKVYIKTKQN